MSAVAGGWQIIVYCKRVLSYLFANGLGASMLVENLVVASIVNGWSGLAKRIATKSSVYVVIIILKTL